MLLLGFSSGIPLYLVGNTLGYWMRENAIELSTIGFLSWVGLAYSLKFLWAPLVDKTDAPLFGRWLGRRRGWMLLAQLVVAAALVGMALVQPREGQLVLAGIVARPVAGVRRAGAGGRVRLGHAGHRHRRLAHRERRQQRAAGPADLDLDARLPRRVAGDRFADPDLRRAHRLVGVVRGDGGTARRRRDRGAGGARAEAAGSAGRGRCRPRPTGRVRRDGGALAAGRRDRRGVAGLCADGRYPRRPVRELVECRHGSRCRRCCCGG